ncbi:MAG: hypothetical protein DDT26_00884 [Dehalococcoidia bacterium]|nr:hypothetical protein [Chloroflexota bacterium]
MTDLQPPPIPVAEPPSRPAYLWVLLMATIAYLILELGFNARLLDVVGSGAELDQIKAIEVWGRAISGLALALALWPFFLNRWSATPEGRAKRGRRTLYLLIACIVLAYVAQEALVRKVVSSMDVESKVQAQGLVLLQQGLLRGAVELPGLEIDLTTNVPPDAKAFVALMPLLGSSVDNLERRFPRDSQKRVLLAISGEDDIDPVEAYEKYKAGVDELTNAYEKYRAGTSRVTSASTRSAAERRANEEWEKYVKQVRQNFRVAPHELNARNAQRVRDRVRNRVRGIPSDWDPADEHTFKDAVYKNALDAAKRSARESLAAAPHFIPRELGWSFNRFINSDPVKTELRSALQRQGITCITIEDPYQRNYNDFYKNIVEAERNCRVKRVIEQMAGKTDAASVKAQEDAAKILWVPPIALFFSLVGAITHLFKTAFLVQRLALGVDALTGRMKAAIVVCGLSFFFLVFSSFSMTTITEKPLYLGLEAMVKEESGNVGPMRAKILRATIQGQATGYPVFEFIRVHLLRGFTFGYVTPETPEPPAQKEGVSAGNEAAQARGRVSPCGTKGSGGGDNRCSPCPCRASALTT